jgi:hypothetical protein
MRATAWQFSSSDMSLCKTSCLRLHLDVRLTFLGLREHCYTLRKIRAGTGMQLLLESDSCISCLGLLIHSQDLDLIFESGSINITCNGHICTPACAHEHCTVPNRLFIITGLAAGLYIGKVVVTNRYCTIWVFLLLLLLLSQLHLSGFAAM